MSLQIFPETNEDDSDSGSYPDDFLYRRERLPSIVVEPTEQCEAESGELRWPPRTSGSGDQEDEDSCQHTESLVDGEQDDIGVDEG